MIKEGNDNGLVHVVFHSPTNFLDIKRFKSILIIYKLTRLLIDNPTPREGAMD